MPERGGEALARSCPPTFLPLLPSTTLWPLECRTCHPLTLEQSLTLPHPCPFHLALHPSGLRYTSLTLSSRAGHPPFSMTASTTVRGDCLCL